MRFENRLVLSAMAGINNAEFCRKHKAALVILGGFNVDDAAMKAAKLAAARGRAEFIFDEPLAGLEEELDKIKGRTFAVNLRASKPQSFVEAAKLVDSYGGIVEINAHCRQPEFIAARCGEWLLFNSDVLVDIVRKVSKFALTAVKIRGSHDIDYVKLCSKLFEAGCRIVHVDAMIPGGGCNYELISQISKCGFTIGNNSFVDVESGEAIIKAGAAMASAARAVLRNPNFFDEMLKSDVLSQPVEL